MSREAILKVKETEARAEQILQDAQMRAKQMREDTERAGIALCNAAEEQAMARQKEFLAQVAVKSEALMERTLAEAQEEADALTEAVSLRRKIGEKIILRGLDSKCR